MAVETYGITVSEVSEGIPFVTIDTSTDPAATAVTNMIKRTCARVNLELKAHGITPSTIDASSEADLYEMIRDVVINRVRAAWLMANQYDAVDYTTTIAEEIDTFVQDLRSQPGHVTGEKAPSRIASHVITTPTTEPITARYWKKSSGFG